MIDETYARLMARYSLWQNESLYAAANTLTDEARLSDRGAFFKSIQATFAHILWGDTMWMSRLGGLERPAAGPKDFMVRAEDWAEIQECRAMLDSQILEWTETLDAARLGSDLTWHSGMVGTVMTRPVWMAVTHMFNHQTHHRGQVHAMLTAAGARPDDTDLIILSPES